MKLSQLLIFAWVAVCACACDKERTTNCGESADALISDWGRKIPQFVWQGHNTPSKEMGETQFLFSFYGDGTFSYTTTTLGLYEGTTLDDISSWIELSGRFSVDGAGIDFDIDKRVWWDAFYPDMTPETTKDPNIGMFVDATFCIDASTLTLNYFNRTFEGPEEHTDIFQRR